MMPSQEELFATFIYDEERGELLWKTRKKEEFKRESDWKGWVKRCAGRSAGATGKNGYHNIYYKGKTYNRTALIWIMKTGGKARGPIRHIDNDSANDKWSNLKESTMSEIRRLDWENRKNDEGRSEQR